MNEEIFNKARDAAKAKYAAFGSVHCPYFKEMVRFNSKGFNHIKFMKLGKIRNLKDQYFRLRFLEIAPIVIKTTSTLQGISIFERLIKKKNKGMWINSTEKIIYYEFIYVHEEESRFKVVVRKDGEGDRYFYSIIPYFQNKNRTRRSL